jgi:hypothetical protein
MADIAEPPEYVTLLQGWMLSYKPQKLFARTGNLLHELTELAP